MHSSRVYEIYANAGERDARDAERDTDEPGMLLGTGRILFLDSGGGGGGVDGEGIADGEPSTVVAILARVLGEIGRRRHSDSEDVCAMESAASPSTFPVVTGDPLSPFGPRKNKTSLATV